MRFEDKNRGLIIALVSVAIVIAVLGSIYGSFKNSYNTLVALNEKVNMAQSDIQTELEARFRKIPDLVAVVEAKNNRDITIIQSISDARAALATSIDNGDFGAIMASNEKLTQAIADFKVVVENYPDLSDAKEYTSLMYTIDGCTNKIAVAERTYTIAVGNYNNKIKSFPTNLFASMFGFEERPYIQASEGAEANSLVNFSK